MLKKFPDPDLNNNYISLPSFSCFLPSLSLSLSLQSNKFASFLLEIKPDFYRYTVESRDKNRMYGD